MLKTLSIEQQDSLSPSYKREMLEYKKFRRNSKQSDRDFALDIIEQLPFEVRFSVTRAYLDKYDVERRTANLYLLEVKETTVEEIRLVSSKTVLSPFLSSAEIKTIAYQCAEHCRRCEESKINAYIVDCGLKAPIAKTGEGFLARVRSAVWWESSLHKLQARLDEHVRIISEVVHRKKSVYVSKNAFDNYLQSQAESEALLERAEMINKDTGEIIPLTEIFEGSLSNPVNRRAELMVRLGGLEYVANNQGQESIFVTITTPSKYHAVYNKSCQKNPKYSYSSPKKAQAYLTWVWSKCRTAFNDYGLEVFGCRVAEPHHDGTPHWHVIIFGNKAHLDIAYKIIREKSLQIDGDEKGAQEKRTECEYIDKSRGSALGYISKYISKNIDGKKADGENVGRDFEAGTEENTANRVRAWASLWGIRQFQFFGAVPAYLWRELRRLNKSDKKLGGIMLEAFKIADEGKKENYGELIELLGGLGLNKNELAIQAHKVSVSDLDKWGDPRNDVIKGLKIAEHLRQDEEIVKWSLLEAVRIKNADLVSEFGGVLDSYEPVITKPHEWELNFKEKAKGVDSCGGSSFELPWIHVNNCRTEVSTGFKSESREYLGYG